MKPKVGFLRYLLVASFVVAFAAENKRAMVVNVGVVLDLNSLVGKMALSCINASLYDFYASHPHHTTTILLHIRHSKADAVGAAAQAMELIQESEVEAILGPERWLEALFTMKVAEKAEVPIISFAPKISTSSYLNSPYFFRVAQNHSSQVHAITHIIKSFRWQQVVAICQDDEFGKWVVADLTNALQDSYVRVHRSVVDPMASSDHIREELSRLGLMQASVFVVHTEHNLASRVFATANELGMMNEGYAWILTDATSNVLNTLNSSILSSMQGVLGVRAYVPRTVELRNFISRWRRKFRQENPSIDDPRVDVHGLWAYDAATALAMAVERITANFTSGVSRNGKRISESLSDLKFRGLSGQFNVIKGQLESPNLEIVNVIGNGEITVGYWTPETGLTGEFNRRESNLRSIIWPGYSVRVPKGLGSWSNAKKKLRIGVVLNDEVSEFAGIVNDSMAGYCIDMFEAAVAELPYDISYEFVHFSNTSSSASYDNLIFQVFEEKYDAAIGDITILANRSLYVDFTLPFTEAGIGAVVPVKHKLRNHAWVFLKPLTLDLWIASFCFFIFMAFVVWILEHRNHQHFRGPPSHQIGTGLWFSFCTIVFAHWETLVSNLARLVVVIWFFVVFILTQSYTASLTSWLTVQQLQPVTDMNEIIEKDWHVGYQNGSYVLHTLQLMGIKNLVPYVSLEQLQDLFTKGSCNGGIDAVIDEIPYMKLFLSKYHDDYIMADSMFKGNGFGFAFPLGSSIVEDMSKAILKVSESDKINQIQEKWFGKKNSHQSCCNSSSWEDSSSSLDLTYFWTLFLIAASVAIFALLLYFLRFIRTQRLSLPRIFAACGSSTLWRRIASTFHIQPSTATAAAATAETAASTTSNDEFGDLSHLSRASSLEIIHG